MEESRTRTATGEMKGRQGERERERTEGGRTEIGRCSRGMLSIRQRPGACRCPLGCESSASSHAAPYALSALRALLGLHVQASGRLDLSRGSPRVGPSAHAPAPTARAGGVSLPITGSSQLRALCLLPPRPTATSLRVLQTERVYIRSASTQPRVGMSRFAPGTDAALRVCSCAYACMCV